MQAEKTSLLTRLEGELSARETVVRQLRGEAETRDLTIANQQRARALEIRELLDNSADLQQQLVTQRGETDRRNGQIQQLQRDLHGARGRVHELEGVLGEKNALVTSILRSRTWRSTAPFRRLKSRTQTLLPQWRYWIVFLPLAKKLRRRRAAALLARTGLVDPHFYASQIPEANVNADLVVGDYLGRGVALGLSPHPLFDTTFYMARQPQVTDGDSPVVHYLEVGAAEGRDPHPLFDTSFYVESNPAVAKAGMNPLEHFLVWGALERRDPHPLFETAFYLDRHPDVAKAGMNPLVHFLVWGALERRDPHPLFDTSFYVESNPAVAKAGMNPLAHFLVQGAQEGCNPHPLFDTVFYLGHNPRGADDDVNPLVHFLAEGAPAGCDPNPSFDTAFYLEHNPAVADAGINPLVHFLTQGASAGCDSALSS